MSRRMRLIGGLLLAAITSGLRVTAEAAAPRGGPERDGLCLWLDASVMETVELQDNRVVRWRNLADQQTYAQAVGHPQRVTGPTPQEARVRFAGHDAFTFPPVAAAAGAVTVFIVAERLPAEATGPAWQRLVSIRSGELPDNRPPNFCFTTGVSTQAFPLTVKVISQDKVAPGALSIGAAGPPLSSGLHGAVAEVLVYNRGFVSEGALQEVLQYLARKWNAQIDHQNSGWTRTGPLEAPPERRTDALPLSDQQDREGWHKYPAFSDEFNGPALDSAKWTTFYQWKGRPPALFRGSNVTVTNGLLQLAMRKEEVPEARQDPRYHTYTSAYLTTRRLTRYGYFEVRARPMDSAGSSSFWFSHGTARWATEIDVFEIGGKARGREQAYNMNCHVFTEQGVKNHWNTGGVWTAPWRLAADFHVYGLAWTPARIVYYVDGLPVRALANTHWHKPMRLIFDSETMPDWFGLPQDADLPSTFCVDYVRTWKQAGTEGDFTPEEAAQREWPAP